MPDHVEDAFAPTIVGADLSEPATTTGTSSSREAVRVGLRPRFEDETASLLRDRLGAASIALVAAIAFTFLLNLVQSGVPLPGLRLALFATLGSLAVLLRFGPELSLAWLRVIEHVLFGAVALTMLSVEMTMALDFSRAGDAAATAASKRSLIAAYTGLILIYGLFVPTDWKRAAAVLLPVSILPFLAMAALPRLHPELAEVLTADRAAPMMPGPVIAAAIAVYGTHSIGRIRREAFKARRFGQYVLGEPLGGGGMGDVYRAEHRLLKRPCAIKLIRPGAEVDERAIARFEREVRATARLSHWNTVDVYDYGRTDDGAFYYVMELLRGLSFEDLVRRHGPLPPGRVVHLLRQVCGALGEAHSAGLVHRDIKPANLFAAERGGVHDVAKLLDFGLARQHGDAAGRPGSISGTPLYMAPEQAADFGTADARSDLYALGAVAYYLLTGRPPFIRDTLMALIEAHATEPPLPPSTLRADIPPDLEAVVLRCLAKHPRDRFPNDATLEAALASCACAGEWTSREAAAWWRTAATTERRRPSDAQDEVSSDSTVVTSGLGSAAT